MPKLIRLRARTAFTLFGHTHASGDLFEASALDAVRLRTSGVVDWAPPASAAPAASRISPPRRRYRRRDLAPEA